MVKRFQLKPTKFKLQPQKVYSNYKFIHPEQKKDEVCIGNTNDDLYKRIGWKTKRKGKISYWIDNTKIDDTPNIFPVFVKKEEFDDFFNGKYE
jgi:hypothetical protein